jgi:hypothetical protein
MIIFVATMFLILLGLVVLYLNVVPMISSISSRASVKWPGPSSFTLSNFDQIPFCLVG